MFCLAMNSCLSFKFHKTLERETVYPLLPVPRFIAFSDVM